MRFKAKLAIAISLFTVLGLVAAPSASADRNWPSVRYRFLADTNLCLEAAGHAVRNNPCDFSSSQLWHYSHGSTDLMLSNHSNDWCMDGNGFGVYLNKCDVTNRFQRWDAVNVNGHVIYKHRNSGKCMESRRANENNILTPCTYFNVQAWDFFL